MRPIYRSVTIKSFGYRSLEYAAAALEDYSCRPVALVDLVTDLHYAGNPKDRATCKRKSKYPSETQARVVGRRVLTEKHQQREAAPERLYPYPCAQCRWWHLTKTPAPHTLPLTRVWLIEGVMS